MSCDCKTYHPLVLIRHHRQKNFVLAARDFDVRLEPFDIGRLEQFWKLACASRGRFFIINGRNHLLMNIQHCALNGNNVTMCGRFFGLNHEWHINSDGSIVNGGGGANLAIDIPRFVENSDVRVTGATGEDAQKFSIEFPNPSETNGFVSNIYVPLTSGRNSVYSNKYNQVDTLLDCKTHGLYVTIRHYRRSNFVLEAVRSGVVLKWESNGRREQLWILTCAEDGTFLIRNCGNKNSLDVQTRSSWGYKLATSIPSPALTQQWYINSDNSIVNAAGDRNMAFDLYDRTFVENNAITVQTKSGADTQRFSLVYPSHVSRSTTHETVLSHKNAKYARRDVGECRSHGTPVFICHHRRKNFVLDAAEGIVKLRNMDNQRRQQLWTLECAGAGRFFVQSVANLKYLTINRRGFNGDIVTTNKRNWKLNQKWYITSDGTIVNAIPRKNLTIDIGDTTSLDDNEVILQKKNGSEAQKFLVTRPSYDYRE